MLILRQNDGCVSMSSAYSRWASVYASALIAATAASVAAW
jgi:hypothetical protein